MLDTDAIQSAVDRMVAKAGSPSRVILFGSYARGAANTGSDLDLLVIEREIPDKGAEYMRLLDALGRVAPGVGVDLLLYPLNEFERRSLVPGNVLYHARREGKILHDSIS